MNMERGVRVGAWGHLPATLGMCSQAMGLHAGVAGEHWCGRQWDGGMIGSAVARRRPGLYLLSRTAG